MTAITYKKGAAFSVLFTVAGKVFSFISSLLLAYYFGADSATDVYFYLILVSGLLNGYLNGINTGVVVPEFMHLNKKDPLKAAVFVNYFLYIYIFTAAVLVAVCFILPEQSLTFLSAFDAAAIEQSAHFMGLSALYFSSFFIMTFLISVTDCFKLFGIYILSPLNSLLPLLLLFLTRRLDAMFVGYILAYVIQIAVCLILLKQKQGWSFKFRKPELSKKFKQNLLFFQPINTVWAAALYAPLFMISAASAGMVSAVNYARMLADSPSDILVLKLQNVSKVKMTAQAADNDWSAIKNTLLRTDIVLMFLLLPFCIFTSVFAFDITKMFFMRGNFTIQAAHDTAVFLSLLILSVPLYSVNTTIFNLFFAIRLVKEITLRYFIFTVIFIFILAAAITTFGPFAYPVVFLMLYLAKTGLNIYTARQFCPQTDYASHILYLTRMAAVCFACAFATRYIFAFYQGNVFIKLLINGSFFVALTSCVFWLNGDMKKFIEAINIKENRLLKFIG